MSCLIYHNLYTFITAKICLCMLLQKAAIFVLSLVLLCTELMAFVAIVQHLYHRSKERRLATLDIPVPI
jgi:hypothetical protein